ncbi:outer-membrane lipoprotein carrier protein LolA [Pelagibacterales bacterium SAG-MED01]|nr:outer-membrane lipoprotein carrier protein LolA [Pelagibacterales bacterium SAG-MED01]|tara:strand:- start:166 stop:714 length:549 start_codon:yes stop_codon:yes gene_type:complete
MKKIFLCLFFIFFVTGALAEIKDNLIKNLKDIKNLNFNFEQNINGKIETGNCTIEYPKKIFCKYDLNNKKILISNGRSLVIKTSNSYYIYPLEKTPLNLILDKNFLLEKIINLNERIINNKLINYNFTENQNEINIFFDKDTFNLIGWQTLDIYQNLNITYLNSLIKNQTLKKNLFKLPKQN